MQWHTVEDLGPTRSLTLDGFMVCRDAVLARCGTQIYGPGETPIQGDAVTVERVPDEVFSPEAIASCQGKPVVNDHPQDEMGGRIDVTPKNWRDLAIGHVINPRRSTDDFLVADLLITDHNAIDLIHHGQKRQLSCGYSADYEEVGPGIGRQRNIRINHVALVDYGRCGPFCSIGDADPNAVPKLAKADVGYESPSQGARRCGECEHWQGEEPNPHGTCEIVEGPIEAADYCVKFVPQNLAVARDSKIVRVHHAPIKSWADARQIAEVMRWLDLKTA